MRRGRAARVAVAHGGRRRRSGCPSRRRAPPRCRRPRGSGRDRQAGRLPAGSAGMRPARSTNARFGPSAIVGNSAPRNRSRQAGRSTSAPHGIDRRLSTTRPRSGTACPVLARPDARLRRCLPGQRQRRRRPAGMVPGSLAPRSGRCRVDPSPMRPESHANDCSPPSFPRGRSHCPPSTFCSERATIPGWACETGGQEARCLDQGAA